MSVVNKNYLDLTGLSAYDTLIKNYINTSDAKAIKTVLWDSTNEQIKFYKKENATLADTADYAVSISSTDVANLKTRVGMTSTLNSYNSASNLTDIINILTGDSSVAGSVAKAAADAVTTAEGYTDTKIEALNADLDASGTAAHSGTFVISGITEADGVITAIDSVEVENAGAVAALDGQLAAVAKSGDAEDVTYDNTDSGLIATDVQAAIDEVVGGLGTAAAADVATTSITEGSTDDDLVSAAQVASFVAAEIAGLTGAMHFRGIITRQSSETDAEAIARTITDPHAGDVVVMSDNAKEYIYDASTVTPSWREVGDETEFVKKTTTIAGVDLQDNITKSELLTALNVEDGAEVNIIESVQVNGSALTPDANRAVNVTVAEGATNGTVAVNGSDVAVHGLGSAAYTASTAYDAAGTATTAVNALNASNIGIASYTATTGATPEVTSITIKGGLTETAGVVGNDSSVDDITIGVISSASINALFPTT